MESPPELKNKAYLKLCFNLRGGGSEADYILLPRVGPLLPSAENRAKFVIIGQSAVISVIGFQAGEFGQERGYTGWIGRNWENGGL